MRQLAKRALFGICLVLLIGLLPQSRTLSFPLLGPVGQVVSLLSYPFLKLQHALVAQFRLWVDRRKNRNELLALVRQYEQTNRALVQETIALTAQQATWEQIQELVDFKKRYTNRSALTVQILFKQFSSQSHFFLVDAGSRRGVTVDMIAVAQNCLVGRVVEVYPYYSKIVLITDPSCKIAAVCPRAHKQGMYGGTGLLTAASMTYLLDTESDDALGFCQGDLILASGKGLVFPRGFGLGRISGWTVKNRVCLLTLEPLLNLRTLRVLSASGKGDRIYCA